MSKWIAEFELEDGDTMPEHMDLNYMGGKIDFYCRPLEQEPCEDCVSRGLVLRELGKYLCGVPFEEKGIDEVIKDLPSVKPQEKTDILDKISTEIDQKQYDYMSDKEYDEGVRFGLMLAYQIIMKYKEG